MSDADGSALTVSDDPGNKLTMPQRQEESSRLYSRGGWRDHSDGNRISTTYGDKVEVVRGNYKMIVMGRQDDEGEAMGWEASGSHIQDFAPGTMPGASFWLEWVNDARYYSADGQNGVWLLVNTTENVYEYARYAGNFREERWGDVIETYVGSENPPEDGAFADGSTDDDGVAYGTAGHDVPERLDDRNYDLPKFDSADAADQSDTNLDRSTPSWDVDNDGMIRSNPHIIEKIWAERIDSYVGTEKCRVPLIREEHWCERFEEIVDCSGDFVTEFTVDTYEETFVATNTITETREADEVNSYYGKPGGKISEFNKGAFSLETTGTVYEQFMGAFMEVFVGGAVSFKFGGFSDMTFGGVEINLDACLLLFDMKTAIKAVDISVAGMLTEVKRATHLDEIVFCSGGHFELKVPTEFKVVPAGSTTVASCIFM